HRVLRRRGPVRTQGPRSSRRNRCKPLSGAQHPQGRSRQAREGCGMSARKTCTRCGQTKGVGEFSKDRSKSDGLRPDCKTCRREYDARYYEENRERRREYNARYRAENRERYREYAARWREENRDNPEYRERARERSARWYAENRERKREYDARWYEENRERIREYDARYHEENPEISRARSARRRARKRGLPDDG